MARKVVRKGLRGVPREPGWGLLDHGCHRAQARWRGIRAETSAGWSDRKGHASETFIPSSGELPALQVVNQL